MEIIAYDYNLTMENYLFTNNHEVADPAKLYNNPRAKRLAMDEPDRR